MASAFSELHDHIGQVQLYGLSVLVQMSGGPFTTRLVVRVATELSEEPFGKVD